HHALARGDYAHIGIDDPYHQCPPDHFYLFIDKLQFLCPLPLLADHRVDAMGLEDLVQIVLDLRHASHIAMAFGKQLEQRPVDTVDFVTHLFLGGAVGGGFDHGCPDGLLLRPCWCALPRRRFQPRPLVKERRAASGIATAARRRPWRATMLTIDSLV